MDVIAFHRLHFTTCPVSSVHNPTWVVFRDDWRRCFGKEQANLKGKKGFWNFIWVIVLWANIVSIEITLLNVLKNIFKTYNIFWKMHIFMIASDQQTLFRASYTAVRRAWLIKGSVYSTVVEYWVKKKSCKAQKHIKTHANTTQKS